VYSLPTPSKVLSAVICRDSLSVKIVESRNEVEDPKIFLFLINLWYVVPHMYLFFFTPTCTDVHIHVCVVHECTYYIYTYTRVTPCINIK